MHDSADFQAGEVHRQAHAPDDPQFKAAVRAGRVVVFYITLPQLVEVPPGTVFTEILDNEIPSLAGHELRLSPQHEPFPSGEDASGKQFLSLRFWPSSRPTLSDVGVLDVPQKVFEATLPPDALAARPFLSRVRRLSRLARERLRPTMEPATVAEAVTILRDTDDSVSDAFDECLSFLAEVVRSYRLGARRPVEIPSLERLPFLVPYFTREGTVPFEWEGPFMFLLHYNVPHDVLSDDPPDEELMKRLFHSFDALKHGNPMVTFSEHRFEGALALLRHGDYADAVIHAQVALEALFDNLLTLMLWEEDVEPALASANEWVDVTLKKRVFRNFPGRLGGNWDPTGTGPLGRWRMELAPLRNRVVHRSYRPSRAEARQASTIASDVATFVFTRLVQDEEHRKTALLTVGLEGFELYGATVTSEIRELAASDRGEWLESYGRWRDDFERASTP